MTEELVSRSDFEAWFQFGSLFLAGLLFAGFGLEGLWMKRPKVWVLMRCLAYSLIPIFVLGLLKMYGTILDRYGLDRIAALVACALLFIVSGLLLGASLGLMERRMKQHWQGPPGQNRP